MLRRALAVTLVSVLALATAAQAALAKERVCRGTIGARTVDNVRVPQSATCMLNGTRVEGTIKVENSATLSANGVRVKGNWGARASRTSASPITPGSWAACSSRTVRATASRGSSPAGSTATCSSSRTTPCKLGHEQRNAGLQRGLAGTARSESFGWFFRSRRVRRVEVGVFVTLGLRLAIPERR